MDAEFVEDQERRAAVVLKGARPWQQDIQNAEFGGVFRLLFPQKVTSIGEKMVASTRSMLVGGVVVMALGAILGFYGYFA